MAAVHAITAEFEEQPSLLDVRKAFDANAEQIHQWGPIYPHFEGEMNRRQIRKGTIEEAFDKADTTFTRMAMDVFLEFGFHMILATPLKLLQTLEDYVGGIGLAVCADFKSSSIGLVSIDDLAPEPAGVG